MVIATVFAALALTVVAAGPDIAPVENGVSSGVDTPDDAVEQPARPGTRAAALVPLMLLGGLAFVAPPVRRRVALLRRRFRRIGDAGDDWRALLLGAPPVAA
ncbi:MAG TPA: hypothetical protein VFX21_06710 [Acidimicrobiia bacterium]|nr:hypothetical protein [Acidimicrobiia bacterium]